jgi:hypothetical protein
MAERPTQKKPRARRSSAESEPPKFVKRPKSERKSLSPELEAFAASDEERLRPLHKPRTPRLLDARPDAPVRGVGNRDARAVFEAHREALASLVEERLDETVRDALAQGLALVVAADMFKANHLASFDAFAVDVLGLPLEEARELASEGASALGLPGQALSEETVASFFRAESALLEAELEGVVGLAVDEGGSERLILDLEGPRASRALYAIGQKVAPLAIDQEKLEQRRAEREADRFDRELEAPSDDAARSKLESLDEGFRPPAPKRPSRKDHDKAGGERRDESRGGFRGERRDEPRGAFRGERREQPRGAFRDRRDEPRGAFGGGFRGERRDEPRGGFRGERRDEPRGGFRDRRDNEPRGAFGGGFRGERRDEPRGGFRGERRDEPRGGFRDRRDEPRGAFGGGFRGERRDEPRGGFRGERRDERRPEFGDRPSRRFGGDSFAPKKKGRFKPGR